MTFAQHTDCRHGTLFFEPSSLDFSTKNQGLLIRLGVQYHWKNHNFKDFTEFLATLNSKHRKSIKKRTKKNSRFANPNRSNRRKKH